MKLGILSNPIAHHNHLFPPTYNNIQKLLKDNKDAVETKSHKEIPDALKYLLKERGVEILGINGGDGTIHSAINALIEMKEIEEKKGKNFRIPPFLFLNGGNYNMAARVLGTKGDPVKTVNYFINQFAQFNVSNLPYKRIPLMAVESQNHKKMYGMIFGSHVVCNALDLCIEYGSGYKGLLTLLTRALIGFLTKNKDWQRECWRLDAPQEHVILDEIPYANSIGGVASTVDLMLVKGLIKSLTIDKESKGFHVKILLTRDPAKIIRLLPELMFEIKNDLIFTKKDAIDFTTWGRFTLDGEIYDNTGKVKVTVAPYSVLAVDQKNK